MGNKTDTRSQFPQLPWIGVEELNTIELRVSGLWFWITRRQAYCTRGAFLAHVEAVDAGAAIKLGLDHHDLWPRYYFDKTRMLLEIEAWIAKRGFWPPEVKEDLGYQAGPEILDDDDCLASGTEPPGV